MLISEREATYLLDADAELTRTPARRLLRTGIAGAPTRDASGRLGYRRDGVEALGRRAVLSEDELEGACPFGLVVARLSPATAWDVAAPVEDQLRTLSGPWRISLLRQVRLEYFARERGHYPLIATVSGFVVAGADVVEPGMDGSGRLVLAEAGGWFARVSDRRWFRGRGGAPLDWWEPRATSRHSDR